MDVEVSRTGAGVLDLRFVLTGAFSTLRLPPRTEPKRVDGLWEHTCFEASVRVSPEAAYFELNSSPSTEWAIYRLDGYRCGMTSPPVAPPSIEPAWDGASLQLTVTADLSSLADLSSDAEWQIGLSAIIEETDGRKSYWALAHPPGDPDFHHSDCFALRLPAAERP